MLTSGRSEARRGSDEADDGENGVHNTVLRMSITFVLSRVQKNAQRVARQLPAIDQIRRRHEVSRRVSGLHEPLLLPRFSGQTVTRQWPP